MTTLSQHLFRRKRTAAVIGGLAIALFASACSGATEGSTPSGSGFAGSTAVSSAAGGVDLSGVTLRVGETGYAQQLLLLQAAGLDDTPYTVQDSVFQGGNLQLEALGADAIDLASASEIPPIFAAQTGGVGTLTTIAVREGTTLQQEVVVPEGSSITSVADLKGKKVAYVQNTTAHLFLYRRLKDTGLSWTDIEPVALSTSDGLAALLGGQVDALASYGTAIITAHSKGATTLVDARDLLSGNYPFLVLPKSLDDPLLTAAIVDFLSREQRAFNWARANPQAWAEVVAAQTKQPVEQALATFTDGEKQRPSRIVPTTDAQIASQQKGLDTFVEAGILPATFDIAPFWTTELNSQLTEIEGEFDAA
jgi:sulfonate transport system substrate-binding protein